MTVSYTDKVPTAGRIGGLIRLLFIWKGSLFKQIFPELSFFFVLYFLISIIYRYILVEYEAQKVAFELWCVLCEKYSKVIPISFLLGFYVTQVVARWWAQFMSIAWPDTLARYMALYIPGSDPRSRDIRRCICRWVALGQVLVLRMMSSKIKQRFPTYEHLVESGLATPSEIQKISETNETFGYRHSTYFKPFIWAQKLVRSARSEGLIANDWFAHILIKELDTVANLNGTLICYGWISIPLVYTQVVTLAVYAYFIAGLFGRQYLIPNQYKHEGDRYVSVAPAPSVYNWSDTLVPGSRSIVGHDSNAHEPDFYIPIFTILEYLFFIGWLKVAETLLNPFGEDDDDFDTHYLIERNLQVSFHIVDEADTLPELEPDPFHGAVLIELNHTVISAKNPEEEKMHMPTDDLELDDHETLIAPKPSKRFHSGKLQRTRSAFSEGNPLVRLNLRRYKSEYGRFGNLTTPADQMRHRGGKLSTIEEGNGNGQNKQNSGSETKVTSMSGDQMSGVPAVTGLTSTLGVLTSGPGVPNGGSRGLNGGITGVPTSVIGGGGVTAPVGGVITPVGGVRAVGGVTAIVGGVASVGGATAPVGGVVAPVGGVRAVGGITLPVGGVTAPVGGVTAPVGGVTAPVGGVTAPVGGVTAPVGGVTAPVGGVTAPVVGVTAPVGGVTAPVGGVTAPVGGLTAPFSGIGGMSGMNAGVGGGQDTQLSGTGDNVDEIEEDDFEFDTDNL